MFAHLNGKLDHIFGCSIVESCFVEHQEISEQEKIAEGSFGTIFKAVYKGQKVAVKRILKVCNSLQRLFWRQFWT